MQESITRGTHVMDSHHLFSSSEPSSRTVDLSVIDKREATESHNANR